MTDKVLKDTHVTSLGLDNTRNDILWAWVKPEQSVIYEVWVERSGAYTGPFDVIAKTYGSTSYTDYIMYTDWWSRYFYRLRVVRRDTHADVEVTGVVTFEGEPDILLKEIRRRGHLLLGEFIGVPVAIYPLRFQGLRCPDCWSDSDGQRIKSGCETCFDTGRLMGYYTPLIVKMHIHEEQSSLSQNPETDEVGVRTATSMLPGDVPIKEGDLVVDPLNDRWIVSTIDPTEKLRARASNRIRLHHVLEKDVRYRVPLPGPNVLQLLARSREYNRPYTLNP